MDVLLLFFFLFFCVSFCGPFCVAYLFVAFLFCSILCSVFVALFGWLRVLVSRYIYIYFLRATLASVLLFAWRLYCCTIHLYTLFSCFAVIFFFACLAWQGGGGGHKTCSCVAVRYNSRVVSCGIYVYSRSNAQNMR